MRIVGGKFRGSAIRAPQGNDIRPTSDRVRESLFNILAHSVDGLSLQGIRVLDLFAGSGALGLEALSRGASFALFVDNDARARGAQRDNIETLGLEGCTRLFRRDALRLGKAGKMGVFPLVFLDPPYGRMLAQKALVGLQQGGWLEKSAICVVEETIEADFEPPEGFDHLEMRRYGGTKLIFLRYRG